MERIKLLDCTLRDGGYVNNWDFGEKTTLGIIRNLVRSNIEYIEVGFLDKTYEVEGFRTRFKNAKDLNDFLFDIDIKKTKVGVLIEQGKYDFEDMPSRGEENNKIGAVRLAFRKSDKEKAMNDLKILVRKGYEVFAQPITTKSYTDREILDLIEGINKIGVYALAIVDTHGSMTIEDFNRIYYIYNNNLDEAISIGFHSHNNTQLSYSLAINAIEKVDSRKLIIDSSLYGMGRGAGNLNTELISEYINNKFKVKKYVIETLVEAIEYYLEAIYAESPWGYSLSQYLSATEGCHPNYAAYLLETKKISHVSIKKILGNIPLEDRAEYNLKLIEELYFEHRAKKIKKIKDLEEDKFKESFILIASGNSVIKNIEKLKNKIALENLKTVGVNHFNKYIGCDLYFFSNQNRYNEFKEKIDESELIVTSNIKTSKEHKESYVLDYKKLIKDDKNDNSTLLFLKYLILQGKKTVSLAGFDGFKYLEENYSYREGNKIVKKKEMEQLNESNLCSLKKLQKQVKIEFVTESIYKN